MTARRFNTSPTLSPALTGGDDQPRARCDRGLVDAVWAGGTVARHARPTLLELCGGCGLRSSCWADPAWRDALRGGAA